MSRTMLSIVNGNPIGEAQVAKSWLGWAFGQLTNQASERVRLARQGLREYGSRAPSSHRLHRRIRQTTSGWPGQPTSHGYPDWPARQPIQHGSGGAAVYMIYVNNQGGLKLKGPLQKQLGLSIQNDAARYI